MVPLNNIILVTNQGARGLGNQMPINKSTKPVEYYVETSQSYVTVKPIFIGQFKEVQQTLHIIWSWIQEIWATKLKTFKVSFHGREITIHFPAPKFIGDGKGFLQLFNLPRAFCYLCFINVDQAQNIEELCKNGMKITRKIEDMWTLVSDLKKKTYNKCFSDFHLKKIAPQKIF